MRLSRTLLVALVTIPPALIAVACSEDNATQDTNGVDGSVPTEDGSGKTTAPPDGASQSAPDASDAGTKITDAAADADADAADADAGPVCTSTPCVVDVGAGSGHACALLDTGSVVCWGENFYGQAGGAPGKSQPTPTTITGLGTVKQLAVGWYHNCALLTDSSVWCWGNNRFAQLALPTDGGDTGSATPYQVTGFPSQVVELAAGGYHTCARLADKTVACWGQNNAGQIGVGDAGLTSSSYVGQPTVVPTIGGVQSFGTTNRVSCVKDQGGAILCWGSTSQGQLGDDGNGTYVPHPAPATVQGIAGDVVEIGKGHGYHQLVRIADGTVQVWGDNAAHIAGFADAGTFLARATTIPQLTAVQVAASGSNSCVRKSDGTVWCWGRNQRGANGLDPTDAGAFQDTPLQVPGIANATHVTVGWEQFGCALIEGASVQCWGDNTYGELGRGSDAGLDPTPQPVAF